MEIVAPPVLIAVQEIVWMLSSGRSVRESVRIYLDHHGDLFAQNLRDRWNLKLSGQKTTLLPPFESHYQSAFWELIERGCAGQPVLQPLKALEGEIYRAAQREMDAHIASLPFKVLLPLLFLQFPAHLLLLVLPLLRDLAIQMGDK